jgi:hypothetical protein
MRVGSRRQVIPVAVALALLGPAAPVASAATTPRPQQITGTVEKVVIDQAHGRGTPDEITTVLRVRGKVVPLTPGSLPDVRSGSTVAATVVPAANGEVRVISAQKVATVTEPGTATVARTVYIALVSPAGYGRDPIQNTVGPAAMVARASSYWGSQTGGQVTFDTVKVLPWYQSAHGCSDIWGIWNEALARMPEAVGTNTHLIVVSPPAAYQKSGCPYGVGTIGEIEGSGDVVLVSDQNQSLYAHELGHNLGLYHSNSLRCNGAQDMPMVGLGFPGCQARAYDDLFDVMGYSGATYGEGSLNAVHLDGMGLLPGAVRTIGADSGVTTARIAPLSTGAADRTLKITDPGGASYFVEYRTDSGLDSVAARNPWTPAWGVRVLRDDPQVPPSAGSYELDASPTSLSSSDYNRSIPPGGTFTAASRKLTIRVAAQDATGATLTITNWAAPLVPAALTQSVPASAWVGAAITATTRVSDQYGRAVAGWPVTLQKLPKGSATWLPVISVRTTSAGVAAYRFANGLSGAYRWVSSPASGVPGRISPAAGVTSVARVVENRPVTSTRYRSVVSVYGAISAVPAPVVYVQTRLGNGPWRTAGRAAVRGTAVSARVAMNVRGSVYTRFYIATRTWYAGSISNCYLTAVR